jgi:hypothetical protein
MHECYYRSTAFGGTSFIVVSFNLTFLSSLQANSIAQSMGTNPTAIHTNDSKISIYYIHEVFQILILLNTNNDKVETHQSNKLDQ